VFRAVEAAEEDAVVVVVVVVELVVVVIIARALELDATAPASANRIPERILLSPAVLTV
jgi:hypothetical protein